MLCAPQTSPAETLGLQLLWETLVAAPLRSGSVSEISVFARPPITTEHTLAHVEVNGVEAEVAPLVCRGVEFLDDTEGPLTTIGHIAQLGPARCAWLLDPDHHTLGVRQGEHGAPSRTTSRAVAAAPFGLPRATVPPPGDAGSAPRCTTEPRCGTSAAGDRAALPDLSVTAETPLWSGATSPRIRDPTAADRAVRTAPRPLSAGRLRARRS